MGWQCGSCSFPDNQLTVDGPSCLVFSPVIETLSWSRLLCGLSSLSPLSPQSTFGPLAKESAHMFLAFISITFAAAAAYLARQLRNNPAPAGDSE